MNKKKSNPILTVIAILLTSIAFAENKTTYPEYIAYNIRAEQIPLSFDSVKVTWKMKKDFPGDFVVGRSESPLNSISDILKSRLVGIFNSTLEGILIDKDLEQGKNYYYVVISKDKLLKREIDILKNVNVTAFPVSPYDKPEIEPGIINAKRIERSNQYSMESDIGKQSAINKNKEHPAKINNTLNKILRLYFYKDRYEIASKELNRFIKNTDNNYQRTLAKLFLGKTYIETGEYEKAILILSSKDVAEAFPVESRFWYEFALLQLK